MTDVTDVTTATGIADTANDADATYVTDTANEVATAHATDATNVTGSAEFNILVNTENISHADWLSYRNLGIGGSDASVVCGINKWKSPIELYMEKKEMLPPAEAGEAAYWGNRLEDLVKEEFTLRTGIEVMSFNAIIQSEKYPWMLANPKSILVYSRTS